MAQKVTSRENSLRLSKKRLEDEIAERTQVEAALKESEQRYRLFTDVAPVGIIVHRDDTIMYANARALAMFRARRKEDLVGASMRSRVFSEDTKLYDKRTHDIIEKDAITQPRAYRWLTLDGQQLILEAVGTRIVDYGGTAILTLLRNLTKQKQDEADKERLLARCSNPRRWRPWAPWPMA